MRRVLGPLLKFLFYLAVLAAVAIGVLRLFFVEMAVVGHNAMAPTLEAGEEVLIWKGADDLEIGDIVVCDHPTMQNDLVVGRVLGKEGMVVDTHRGELRVAGQVPDTDRMGTETFVDNLLQRTDTMRRSRQALPGATHDLYERSDSVFVLNAVQVGPAKIFLLSDNRQHPGQDSRTFGPIDPRSCIGTVFMRLSPADGSPNDLGHGWLDIVQ